MKKIIIFIAGFLVGTVSIYTWGQLFSNDDVVVKSSVDKNTEITNSVLEPVTSPDDLNGTSGDIVAMSGKLIVLPVQQVGNTVKLSAVSMPKDGWVVVHEIKDGVVMNALGATRRDTGEYTDVTVYLLRDTIQGGEYAVVLYDDNGDKKFSLASDVPLSDGNGGFIMQKFNIK